MIDKISQIGLDDYVETEGPRQDLLWMILYVTLVYTLIVKYTEFQVCIIDWIIISLLRGG